MSSTLLRWRTGARGVAYAPRPCVRLVSVLALVLLSAAVLSAAEDHCSDPVEAYYMANGRDYEGHVNVTEGGIPCQRWTAQWPNEHDTSLSDPTAGLGDHNYCRNPSELDRPWCVTTDPGIPFQYCDVGAVCPVQLTTPSVSASPPSGTLFLDQASAVVSLSCFPRPCDLYYTVDGSQPAPGNASAVATRAYEGPIQLSANVTIKYAGVFANAVQKFRVAFYTIAPSTVAKSAAYFIPTDAVDYTSPVLVALNGLGADDTAVYYVGDAFQGVYTAPFWLSASSTVTAVVNGRDIVESSYTIQAIAPAIALYPPSGTYIGGTSVLVYPTSTETATFYISLNDSDTWETMTSMRRTIDAIGVTRVSVRAVYLGGLTSNTSAVYVVLPASAPVIQPSPLQTYTRPVQFVCQDPAGRLLPFEGLSVDGAAVYTVRYSSPGNYPLRCTYTDNLHVVHETNATGVLLAASLPSPRYVPTCGDVFPWTALTLRGEIVPPADNDAYYNGSGYGRLSVTADVVVGDAYARVDGVERVGELSVSYRLTPAGSPTTLDGPPLLRVLLTAASTDPMESTSQGAGCGYELYPPGTGRTTVVAARPAAAEDAESGATCVCAVNADGELSDACAAAVAARLAGCLRFNTTELISASHVGPYVLFSIGSLNAAIVDIYSEKLLNCTTNATLGLTDTATDAENAIALATGWRVVAAAAGNYSNATATQSLTAGTSFLVEIGGYHVDAATDYRFVREDYSCDDIGYESLSYEGYADTVSATAMQLFSRTGAVAQTLAGSVGLRSAGDDTLPVIFSIDAPGRYKLCATFGNATYAVPSRYSAIQPVLVTTPAGWPAIVPSGASASCGGLVGAAHADLPITVSFQAEPQALYYSFFYSFDAAAWYTTSLGTTVTLPKKVDGYATSSETIAASLGPAAGAAAPVCVYYAPSTPSSITTGSSTYSFYKSSTVTDLFETSDESSSTTAEEEMVSGMADVVISLHGSFESAERIIVRVQEVLAGPATGSLDTNATQYTLVASTLASTSAGLNYTRALPDYPVRLSFSRERSTLEVFVERDGDTPTRVSPQAVALSPLSVAMVSCKTCKSGYCYGQKNCVCIGEVNKTAYFCDYGPTPVEPDVPTTPVYERLLLLAAYFALLIGIGVGFAYEIRRGAARHQQLDAEAAAADGSPRGQSPPSRPRGGRAVDVTVVDDNA